MASRLSQMRIGDVDVLVETTVAAGSEQAAAIDTLREKASDSFERAKATIVAVGKSTADVIARLSDSPVTRPASVEVEIGLGFTANGNVVLAGASASANLNVRLVYTLAASEPDGSASEPGGSDGKPGGSDGEPGGSAAADDPDA